MTRTKRAFIIHGWDGYPEEGWFPWAKEELEKRGFIVTVPKMPHADRPNIDGWVGKMGALVGVPDENAYLIGHSIGCQTILRYLAALREGKKVGGVVLVAGFFELVPLESEEEKEIIKPWLETPIDFERVKAAAGKITVILSDNDEWVPLERNKQLFEQRLAPKIIVKHNMGHFSGSNGIKKLPVVLETIERYSA